MTQYLVHKPVSWDKVAARAKAGLGATTLEELRATGRYWVQPKFDGCCAVVQITPSTVCIQSRTGETVDSCRHILHALRTLLAASLARGESWVVFGEVWARGLPQSEINGSFRRHDGTQDTRLHLMVFDMVPLADWHAGASWSPYYVRYERVTSWLRASSERDTIQPVECLDPADEEYIVTARRMKALGGYDGIIVRDPDAGWQAGPGTGGEIIKVKPLDTFDLQVEGIQSGKGKYAGKVGALICRGPTGPLPVSGMTDEQRIAWYSNPEQIVGKVVEVTALGRTRTGNLREPRMTAIRYDKEDADY